MTRSRLVPARDLCPRSRLSATLAIFPLVSCGIAAPLSPTEAELIVRAEAEARRLTAEARVEQLDSRPAVDRSYLDLDGHVILYNRAAPVASAAAPGAAAPSLDATNDADAADETISPDEAPPRPQRHLFLSATVYEGPVTELRWHHAGREYHAFSTIDFRDFGGINEIATADADHHFFMGLGPGERDSAPDGAPVPSAGELAVLLDPARGYLLVEPAITGADGGVAGGIDATALAEGLAVIEAMHRHHRAHRAELQAARQRRETLEAARERHERELRENPPEPLPTVINFAPIAK